MWLKRYIDLFDTAKRHMPLVRVEYVTWAPDGRAVARLSGRMPEAKDALSSISEGHTLYIVYKCSGKRDEFSDTDVVATLHVTKPPRFRFECLPAISPSEDGPVEMFALLQCQFQIVGEGDE